MCSVILYLVIYTIHFTLHNLSYIINLELEMIFFLYIWNRLCIWKSDDSERWSTFFTTP